MDETLQAGANIVAEQAEAVGLACSPTKSELLVLHPPKCRTDMRPPPKIEILLDNHLIPEVDQVRILGLVIQNNGKNKSTIKKLTNTVHQTMRLIRRIANRHRCENMTSAG